MNTYIALFRGINVGGHNKLPMKELRALLASLGHQNVDSYIQTGNVIFQTEKSDKKKIAGDISTGVENKYGFKPNVLLLELEELEKAITSNPFPDAVEQPKSLHLMFLAAPPSHPDLESLVEIKKDSERFELKDKVFYLHTPDGFGRSKLAGKTEKALGVSMTGRNWRTIQKIAEMAEKYY